MDSVSMKQLYVAQFPPFFYLKNAANRNYSGAFT